MVKMAKDKETVLKEARGKQVTFKGNPVRLPADSSAAALWARRGWQDPFKVLRERTLQPRIISPAKNSRRDKALPRPAKTKGLLSLKPAWPEMAAGL